MIKDNVLMELIIILVAQEVIVYNVILKINKNVISVQKDFILIINTLVLNNAMMDNSLTTNLECVKIVKFI